MIGRGLSHKDSIGFASYGAIQQWIATTFGVPMG